MGVRPPILLLGGSRETEEQTVTKRRMGESQIRLSQTAKTKPAEARMSRWTNVIAKILFSILFGGILVAIQAWYWAWPVPFFSWVEHLLAAIAALSVSVIAVIFLIIVWQEDV